MDDISRLLSQGGVILGIAAFSQSKGIVQWDVLGPALRNPVQRCVRKMASPEGLVQLAKAVAVATTQPMPVSVSSWVAQIADDSALRARIGTQVSVQWPPGSDRMAPDGEKGGIIALAVALCRNSDMAQAVSGLFDEPDRTLFWDVASVAAVLADPGIPSALRRQIKKCVLTYTNQSSE